MSIECRGSCELPSAYRWVWLRGMTERAKTTLFDGTAKIHVGFGTIEVVWSDKGGFAGWCLRAGLRLRERGINNCYGQQTRADLSTKISHGLTLLTEQGCARCPTSSTSC